VAPGCCGTTRTRRASWQRLRPRLMRSGAASVRSCGQLPRRWEATLSTGKTLSGLLRPLLSANLSLSVCVCVCLCVCAHTASLFAAFMHALLPTSAFHGDCYFKCPESELYRCAPVTVVVLIVSGRVVLCSQHLSDCFSYNVLQDYFCGNCQGLKTV
jgi:hypothetical protein